MAYSGDLVAKKGTEYICQIHHKTRRDITVQDYEWLAGDVKEPTHLSKRVGHGVSRCCGQALVKCSVFHGLVL